MWTCQRDAQLQLLHTTIAINGLRGTTMMSLSYGVLVTLVLMWSSTASGFNIDTSKAVIHSGPANSFFGYSVAQHNDSEGQWLLAGAPKLNNLRYVSGDVYKCDVTSPGSCQPMQFDRYSTDSSPFNVYGSHSDQWLGSVVVSAESTGNIAACAPRFWFHGAQNGTSWEYGNLVGGCYAWTPRNGFKRFDPCVSDNDKLWPKDRQFMCESGMSAVFNKKGTKIVFGAPGSYSFQGQLISQNVLGSKQETTQLRGDKAVFGGNMGFSIAIGFFNNDGYNDYVSGAPRINLIGQVKLYDHKMDSLKKTINGEQMGEYFGYSVTASDYNRDTYDDIAIGAPFYSDYQSGQYDCGRVYIYYQNSRYDFDGRRTILDGPKKPGCRFGSALADGQDLNRDGYPDLIVGAPYGGTENSQGAIYVYHGSATGIKEDFSQVIQAADLSRDLQAFGGSISAGRDQDDNGYPDLVVGAYEGNRAVYLKSRPIVTPVVSLEMSNNLKINLEQRDCTDSSGNNVTCFTATVCVDYEGYRIPDRVAFKLLWNLDVYKQRVKRAFFLDKQQHMLKENILVKKGRESCTKQHRVAIRNDLRDKLSPISVKVAYSITERPVPGTDLLAIQDDLVARQTVADVHIIKYCGEDEVCVPDLHLTAKSSIERLAVGETPLLDLNVRVLNMGEGSYESLVYTLLPIGISYINVHNINQDVVVTCGASGSVNGTVVVCDVGNPLPSQSMALFRIRASVSAVSFTEESLELNMLVNSTNAENSTDLYDNQVSIPITLVAEAAIEMTGNSVPETVLYNSTTFTSQPFLAYSHVYQISNLGPSNISQAVVRIYWPAGYNIVETPDVLDGSGQLLSTDSCNTRNISMDMLSIVDQENFEETSAVNEKVNVEDHEHVFCRSGVKRCVYVECQLSNLNKGDTQLVKLKAKLKPKHLIKSEDDQYKDIIMTSFGVSTVTEFPYNVNISKYSKDTFQIDTLIASTDKQKKQLPIWIIIIAVVVGILILGIVMLIFWKCGFFKRKTHEDLKRLTYHEENNPDAEEMHPMNPAAE